ncbi:MAG: hypothetical protein ACJ71M_06915, partial [Nitrososphaeraceae archaeon]
TGELITALVIICVESTLRPSSFMTIPCLFLSQREKIHVKSCFKGWKINRFGFETLQNINKKISKQTEIAAYSKLFHESISLVKMLSASCSSLSASCSFPDTLYSLF